MSIATMNNDQATDAMIRISNALSFICEDKEVTDFINELSNAEDEDVLTAIPKYLPRITAFACKRHKESVYDIVSALSGKSDVGNMNFLETVRIIREDWGLLRDFFTSSAGAADGRANK